MNSTKEKTNLEQLVESAVNSYDCTIGTASTVDTITLGDTIDLSMLNNMATNGSPYTVTTGISGGFTTGTGWTTNTATPWFTQSPTAATIKLDGEGADIVVNGHSLVEAVNNIQQRLNCLQVNPELEKEWDQLKALGDQYRELEQQILDKQGTWDRLRAMPKIEVD